MRRRQELGAASTVLQMRRAARRHFIETGRRRMRLVLSADDFGYSADTVERTIRCIEDGVLTSASLMAKMPATADAVAYARTRPDVSFGVHLVFCDDEFERPVSPTTAIRSLVDRDGRFLSTRRVIAHALLERFDVSDIEREIAAQVSILRDSGVNVQYVDGHGNLHKFAPFAEALRRVAPRFGIRKVRRTQNVYLNPAWRNPNYWMGERWNRRIAANFVTTDAFFLPASTGGGQWAEAFFRWLREFQGVVELGVHPGAKDAWRADEERNLRALARLVSEAGIETIGWGDV